MFFPGSRYYNLTTYPVTLPDGTIASATRLPRPMSRPLLGFYPRQNSQRLDQLAAHFLGDATTFWQLCDANGSVVPDALASHGQIGIPGKGA